MFLICPRKGTRTHTNYTAGGAAVQIALSNRNRKSIVIQNQGSGVVYVGGANVATSGATRGYAIFAGLTFTDNASDGEWWVIAGASQVVHVIEVS